MCTSGEGVQFTKARQEEVCPSEEGLQFTKERNKEACPSEEGVQYSKRKAGRGVSFRRRGAVNEKGRKRCVLQRKFCSLPKVG